MHYLKKLQSMTNSQHDRMLQSAGILQNMGDFFLDRAKMITIHYMRSTVSVFLLSIASAYYYDYESILWKESNCVIDKNSL